MAAQAIDYDGILSRMTNVKWDISDLMSQHSQYVDILLRQLQVWESCVVSWMPDLVWNCESKDTTRGLLAYVW